ncbi:membrane-binding protein [Ligilactobacillus apodemi]|uniref:MORN repeat-containing protein n=1 Tax=Ligilactobacillus apodemi DSM 16634 = JCM 16172 TaxID=1423724 RepID=A0A0R1TX31_9LACO|nr:membrane-binding protein [Ligilactobacillus apodemi]KRL84788.1 MORN repeat-containing protein [Ligilactobacillus apodemi DSM 16634 = JCM 16172]MCR1901110.1 membrane-binding protein [Ligilactobacillus apodemi]
MRGRKSKILAGVAVLLVICISATFLLGAGTRQTKMTFQDGAVYTGTIKSGQLVKGTLKFKNGDTYTGSFKNGHFNGQGTFKSHAGWTYTGTFKDGLANGSGTLTKANKVVQKGTFVKGEYQEK